MSLIPSTHSRFAWFQTGLFGGAGRGGPGRLVMIGGVLACMAGGAYLLSVRHGNGPPVSQVAKMKPGNLLPGGLQGTPAQDALQKEDSQEKAKAAEAAHKSYTPPIPSSTAFNGALPTEVGLGAPVALDVPAARPMPPAPAIVTPAAPTFTPPEHAEFDRPAGENEISGARVTRIAAGDVGGDETSEGGKRGGGRGRRHENRGRGRRGRRNLGGGKKRARAAAEGDRRPRQQLELPAAADDGGDPASVGEAGRRRSAIPRQSSGRQGSR